MKTIPLTQNKFAIIDDEDFEKISQYKWHASPNSSGDIWYALSCVYAGIENGKQKSIRTKMHRLILGVDDPKIKVDHKNGNGLDNRKENLRQSDNFNNQRNRTRKNKRNTSGYRGIYCDINSGRKKKWMARIQIKENSKTKNKNLDYFETAEEAARAFDKAARELYGEFCGKLNFDDK